MIYSSADKVIGAHSGLFSDDVCMVVHPKLSAGDLCNWFIQRDKICPILSHKNVLAVENIVVNPVDDPLGTVIAELSLTLFPFECAQWNSAVAMKFNDVLDRAVFPRHIPKPSKFFAIFPASSADS